MRPYLDGRRLAHLSVDVAQPLRQASRKRAPRLRLACLTFPSKWDKKANYYKTAVGPHDSSEGTCDNL